MSKRNTSSYSIVTSQDADAILRALSDGHSGRHWMDLPAAVARVHQTPNASHHVQLYLPTADIEHELEELAGVTAQLNADHAQMILFINSRMSENAGHRATVELDELIAVANWYPQNSIERDAARAKVWRFIRFIAASRVVGQRTYKQKDKSGQEVSTYIESAPWAITDIERLSLFDDEIPPRSVHLVASEMWARLTMHPEFAQYLPGGELLGQLPSGKPAGVWARCIGLVLANLWRRNPREALTGKIKPTRHELLDRYSIHVAPPFELLAGKKSKRALEYWHDALALLVEAQFLESTGEAALTLEERKAALPSRYWTQAWLKGKAELRPGNAMIEAINDRSNNIPEDRFHNVQR